MELESSIDSIHLLRRYISQILTFITNYKWLIDSYLSDYFVEDLPSQLPRDWWNVLSTLEPDELASLLHANTWKSSKVWPLSLLAFRSVVTGLCAQREPVDVHKLAFIGAAEADQTSDGVVIKDGQYMDLQHCYRRHVKPKKQHEIVQLGQVIRNLCDQCACDQVVDVGSGQGHLARLLTYGLGVKVTTIEAAGCHRPKAQKYDKEVSSDIMRGRVSEDVKQQLQTQSDRADSLPEPDHIVAMIDPSIPVNDFLDTLNLTSSRLDTSCPRTIQVDDTKMQSISCDTSDEQITSEDKNNERGRIILSASHLQSEVKDSSCNTTEKSDKTLPSCTNRGDTENKDAPDIGSRSQFVLTGLHACGDLTPTMIRVYTQCNQAVGLASVGCCYMKLSTQSDREDDSPGYPMSGYIHNLPDHPLSYEAREMACHFIDSYHDRLQGNEPQLRSHVYRAALQEVIREKAPHIHHGCIKLTVKHTHNLNFQQYAESALRKLDIDTTLTLEQISRAEERLSHWREVVAFYTIRLSLAPLVEVVLLVDRMIYLTEKGISCRLLPIFDPRLSPRNFVLLANKAASL